MTIEWTQGLLAARAAVVARAAEKHVGDGTLYGLCYDLQDALQAAGVREGLARREVRAALEEGRPSEKREGSYIRRSSAPAGLR